MIFDEACKIDVLIQRIQMGLWKPPNYSAHGPFQTLKEGETLVETPAKPDEKLCKRLNFSPTESRILQGLASGLNEEQLAVICNIKPRTVRFYIARLKTCLHALTKEHLVAKAGFLGLYDSSSIGLEN